MPIDRQNKPQTANSAQELQNDSFDRKWNTMVFQMVAEAVDGPDTGSLVYIKAGYNSTTGNYELLTAGSGTTTTVDKDGNWNSTNTLWNDTSINWNQT
jgi:hypothetical protein